MKNTKNFFFRNILYSKKGIIKGLNRSIKESGLSEYVEYAVLTGGYILNKNTKRDIDLIVVLKDRARKDLKILEKINTVI